MMDDEKDVAAYMSRLCLIETPSGAFAHVTLLEAVRAIARCILAENHGVELGEYIAIGTTVDRRASVRIEVTHADDDSASVDVDDFPPIAETPAGSYGPS